MNEEPKSGTPRPLSISQYVASLETRLHAAERERDEAQSYYHMEHTNLVDTIKQRDQAEQRCKELEKLNVKWRDTARGFYFACCSSESDTNKVIAKFEALEKEVKG